METTSGVGPYAVSRGSRCVLMSASMTMSCSFTIDTYGENMHRFSSNCSHNIPWEPVSHNERKQGGRYYISKPRQVLTN